MKKVYSVEVSDSSPLQHLHHVLQNPYPLPPPPPPPPLAPTPPVAALKSRPPTSNTEIQVLFASLI